MIQRIRCFLSVNYNHKSLTHNILLTMYHFFYFRISNLGSHKLYYSKVLITISNNGVVSKWYLILLEQYFQSNHHHNRSFTNIFLFHLYLFHISIIWSQNIYWLIDFHTNKRTPRGKWICFGLTKLCFKSIHNHN